MSTSPLTIGALARLAGISPQTLRHYDRLGLLRPSSRTRAKYRMYTEADRVRLDLIRALRALDFDLTTIAKLLRGAMSPGDVTRLHLQALDHQVRVLARRRAVLRVLLRDEHTLTFERLQRLQVLAAIEDRDRAAFVGKALAERLRGTTPTPLGAAMTRLAMVELPEHPSDAQVDAWLELAEMVADDSFLARHRKATKKASPVSAPDMASLCGPAAEAADKGLSPSGKAGRAIVVSWIDGMLRTLRRPPAGSPGEKARELLRLLEQHGDTREQRFWQLLAVLNPEVARSPITRAWPWLTEGLVGLAGESDG